ncbi:E3 ubiquitin-protein ligase listerin [Cydia amplana]|uniref:E3 ubiquitin-protein ligase listerin n=1 Tax=Cydia amplana TaxID=1869771 RepID=UPI002FE54763
MGGKTKQTQRTKNNVRPSSSGRSAELLNNAVRMDPGLMSTSSGKVLPVLFPTLAAPLDPTLNPDFMLCLKKLNKKDPITKTKALQELCDLIRKGDVEDVIAALGSWAHYYKQLTTDTDHKVREAAQVAHGVIAGACGRRLAPHLKSLLPPWLQAQYDEYAPAATAARASLTSTFPESKLPDVISFCMSEVIAHLLENLVGNAEAALSKKILTPEEKELQWARLVTASLQGLEFFVQHLPSQHDDWLWAELTPLLAASSFWKMPFNKSQQVRASWFGALGRIIGRYGDTFGAAHGSRTAKLLLGAPSTLAQQWCCLLVLLRHVKDDTWLDKKDLLIKRIIDVLENGGWGDAKHLSSILLPLLAFLPQHMLTKQFYETFFNAVFKGLEKKSVISSKSERQSWIASLSECLRYLSLQHTEFMVEVATAVHRTWLEKILAGHDGQTTCNLVRYSGGNMASLVKYWLRQSLEAKEGADKYDQLARNFWQNIASTVVAQIDKLSTNQNDITALVDAHILLLQTLKTSQETKKPKSIKFNDEKQAENDDTEETSQQCNASIDERYKHNLNNVVEKICAQYFEYASKKQVANAVFTPLLTLLIEFDDKNLFLALSKHFDSDTIYGFYDKTLKGWLAGDTMRCKAAVDIVFLLMKHLSEKEQDALLDSFKQFPPSVVEWCISLSLSHPHCRLPAVRRWLRGTLVEDSLVAVCRRMINEDDSKSRSLLLMCLATDDDGEIMISQSSVSKIMELVCSALSPAAPSLERLAGAAAALASELAGSDCTQLALSLFRLQLTVQRGSGLLNVETWCEVRSAWQDAGGGRQQFRAQATRAATQELVHGSESLDVQRVEHIASLCPYLLPQFGDSQLPGDTGDVAALLKQLFRFETREDSVEVFALRHDCIHSNLNCPLDDTDAIRTVIQQSGDSSPELDKKEAIAYMNKVVFRAALLRTLILHRNEDEQAWGEELFKNEYILEELARVLHDYAVVSALFDGYAFWPSFEIISVAKQHLTSIIDAITSDMTSHFPLLNHLTQRAATEGYYWSFAKVILEEKLRERGRENRGSGMASHGVKLEEIVTGNGFFHTLQAESRSSPDSLAPLRAKYLVMLRSFYLAHAHEPGVIDATFISEAAAGVATDASVIVNAYYRHQHTMLYESDISKAEWRQVVSNTAIVEYLTEMVDAVGWEAAAASWDFTTISLCSLAGRIHPGCPKMVEAVGWQAAAASWDFTTISLCSLAGRTHPGCPKVTTHNNTAIVEYLTEMVEAVGWEAAAASWDFTTISLCSLAGRTHPGCPKMVEAVGWQAAAASWDFTTISLCSLAGRTHPGCPKVTTHNNTAIVEYLTEMVEAVGWEAAAASWDFTTISLCSLAGRIHPGCPKATMLARSVLRLFLAVQRFVNSIRGECLKREPLPHVAELPTEWKDIFSPDLQCNLFSIVVKVLGEAERSLTAPRAAFIDALLPVARTLDWHALPQQYKNGELSVARLLQAAVTALCAPAHPAYKYLAHGLLAALAKPLVLHDVWSPARSPCDYSESPRSQLAICGLQPALTKLQELVDAALHTLKVGEETCEMVPGTDSHSVALGYLLLGDAACTICQLSRGDLVHHYIEIFREPRHAEVLVACALRLLPAAVAAHAQDSGTAPAPAQYAAMFLTPPEFSVRDPPSALDVGRLSCRSVCHGARWAGGALRGWWGAAPARAARALERLLKAYVSPHLIKEQLTAVSAGAEGLEDAEVTVHPSTNEVVVTYLVEDRPLELSVSLGAAHPLHPPRVAAPRAPHHSTHWLAVYLAYQNGTVLNAIRMWMDTVAKRVEASPQCYICYCRLQPSTGRLPRVACHQCRNKFHAECLRKWFQTSSKSNCPLCRANF